MPEHRRKFSPRFKAEAVQRVISAGKPIAEVARDLGIHDGTLGNWVNAWRREHPEPDQPLSPVERARVKELEAEVAVARPALHDKARNKLIAAVRAGIPAPHRRCGCGSSNTRSPAATATAAAS